MTRRLARLQVNSGGGVAQEELVVFDIAVGGGVAQSDGHHPKLGGLSLGAPGLGAPGLGAPGLGAPGACLPWSILARAQQEPPLGEPQS